MRGKVARALRRLSDFDPRKPREYGRAPDFTIWHKDQNRRMYKTMKQKYKEMYGTGKWREIK